MDDLEELDFKSYMQSVKRRLKSNEYNRYHGGNKVGNKYKLLNGSFSNVDIEIRKLKADEQEFYDKVCKLLMNEASNPLSELTDKKIFESLKEHEKQRYMLKLSEKYIKCKDKFNKEHDEEREVI